MKNAKITHSSKTNHRLKTALCISVTLIVCAAVFFGGYHLTKRYQSTITNAYDSIVNSIADRIDHFQTDVETEISNITPDKPVK